MVHIIIKNTDITQNTTIIIFDQDTSAMYITSFRSLIRDFQLTNHPIRLITQVYCRLYLAVPVNHRTCPFTISPYYNRRIVRPIPSWRQRPRPGTIGFQQNLFTRFKLPVVGVFKRFPGFSGRQSGITVAAAQVIYIVYFTTLIIRINRSYTGKG